ncbi:hypothetical protein PAHAL_5G089200 [Panicum hallii]|uniref:Laccase n=1 Tax=Panicum hallii TaxID=206008 RepID=A0A2S3HQ03_9POAL|nr:laccase-6-like [Panicum hallii]PAN27573.1 hypothetical protein PAHAL_5G089200 [Panicum hallii]
MPGSCLILVLAAVSSAAALAHAATVEHTFNVAALSWPRICQPGNISITAVDGVPGPVIEAYEGDTVVVHVINDSPYDVTIHWHGVFQRGTPWADGPSMVTQCPIRPGSRYTYRFSVAGQEGTLWWHAHSSFLRATVHGALIIRPRLAAGAYPFPQPDGEAVVLLGEWWDADIVLLERQAFLSGTPIPSADAYTINGKPNRTEKFSMRGNSTYLLRIINAALNTAFFFKVAGHTFTVVAADASYTSPYETDVIVIAPGQTVDALMAADATPGCYYMAISSYQSAIPLRPGSFNGDVTTAVVEYVGAAPAPDGQQAAPAQPEMPELTDTATANRFYTGMIALVLPGRPTVPLAVDTRMFVTVGLGFSSCQPEQTTCNRNAPVVVASMNNESFTRPTTTSLLDARYGNASDGVYTSDFPDRPPVAFDYTNATELVAGSVAAALSSTGRPTTKVRALRYNATVEVVLQNTALVGRESHPMHLHGFNFFVVAQGFGNYGGGAAASERLNLVNPQQRNTIAVPTGGWAVIRFVADNPGMWFMHCHIDSHLSIGLAMVFEVEDGPTPDTKLPPPPPDLPRC